MTKLELINSALIHAGAEMLHSLDRVSSKSGSIALAQYDLARKGLLRQHQWNFAISRAELDSEPVPPTLGYSRTYILPDDFLRMDRIYDDYEVAYEIQGRKILIDLGEPLHLVYVADTEDPEEWDPLFQEAFSYHLASKIVFALTQDMNLSGALDQFYSRALVRAKWADSTENSMKRVQAYEWLASRYGWRSRTDRFHSFTAPEEPFP